MPLTDAANRYSEDCERVLGGNGREYILCRNHATRMQNAASHAAIWKLMDTAVNELLDAKRLPPWVVVSDGPTSTRT